MNLNTNFKLNVRFFLAILFVFIAQFSHSKASFPTKVPVQDTYETKNETRVKKKHSKLKSFKELFKKKERTNFFGGLALIFFLSSIFSLIALPSTIIGLMLAAFLFTCSCLAAYYGISKDKKKRLAKLTLIVELVIVLSAALSFLVITVISL